MTDAGPSDADATHRGYVSGLLLVLGASVLWSLSGALIKLAHREGADGVTIAFYRSFFAGLVLIPLARRKLHTLGRSRDSGPSSASSDSAAVHPPAGCWRNPLRALLSLRRAATCCVVFFTLMTVCFAVAFTKTEAANVIILQYTSTFWVFALSPRVTGEKPRGKDFWILGLAMIGIAVLFAGNFSADLAGLVIALTSGLFYALLTLMIRIMRDSDPAAVTLLNNLGSALLLLPVVLIAGDLRVSQAALIWLVLLGVFQFGLPYYMFALGLARLKAYQAAMTTLIEPVLVPVWAYLAVQESVPASTLIGGGLILAALLFYLRAARGGRPDS